MNREIATKWVALLRSGEFEQGKQTLRKSTPNGMQHCCLGVLCELYRRETGKGTWLGEAFCATSLEASGILLPGTVMAWAGMRTASGVYGSVGSVGPDLTTHNDNGVPFSEIADIIEENIDQL